MFKVQLESIAPPIPSHGQRNAMQGNYCNTILSSIPNHGQLVLQVGVFVPTLNLLGSQVFTESRSSSLEIQLLLLPSTTSSTSSTTSSTSSTTSARFTGVP